MKKTFMREKIVRCGDEYIFPEIYRYSENQQNTLRMKRAAKQNETRPKQKCLNNRRAQRYFIQLSNGNFGKGDVVVHLTIAPEHMPPTPEEALRIVTQLYMRRVAYEMKRRDLTLKYIVVMQIGRKKDGTHRIHFHILMSGGLERDVIENLWWIHKGSKKENYRDRVLYGWANADRLRPNGNGISQIAGYIVQDSVGKKHWTQSQNLIIPWHKRPNDSKYTPRQIERLCRLPQDCEEFRQFWEKKYPAYEYVSSERSHSEENGWSVYLMMRHRKNC